MKVRQVRGVTFTPDGVFVEFMSLASDIRDNGLVMNHTLLIPDENTYHDAIDALITDVLTLLDAALTDFESSPPTDMSDELDDEGDDGPGPYDNPLERDIPGVDA